jgi:hypothetical protein
LSSTEISTKCPCQKYQQKVAPADVYIQLYSSKNESILKTDNEAIGRFLIASRNEKGKEEEEESQISQQHG